MRHQPNSKPETTEVVPEQTDKKARREAKKLEAKMQKKA